MSRKVDECKPLPEWLSPQLGMGWLRMHSARTTWQGLTLLHFSAQPEPCSVTEATASFHFSASPETLLPMTPPDIANEK